MNKIILLFFIWLTVSYSQSIKVLENRLLTNEINEQYFHPHFNDDDSKIIVTKSNYKGLYLLDIKTNNLETITEEQGAGYKPVITGSGKTILYRPFVTKSGKKYHSLKSIDTDTKAIKIIENGQRNLSVPNQLNTNKMFYLNNGEVREVAVPERAMAKTIKQNKAVYVKNNSLYLVENNETVELNPLGKGVYVWASLSPEGNKIIFTFGNKGTYVCDLNGNILLNIKDAHYPKFSPDGKYISYMIDKDNGYNYTSSDLFIYSIDEQKSYPVTNTEAKIEMFPEWSHSGNEIVYQTTEGEIYLMKLNIKN